MILNKSNTKTDGNIVDQMFEVGAHFGYERSRRHPSALPYIFGVKNKVEIFDLEKVSQKLNTALEFVKKVASEGKQILIVGGKREASKIVKDAADKMDLPYVSGRWIGGTLTNFEEIRKRVNRFVDLTNQKAKGELAKYTKKERLLIERELAKLEERFGGVVDMATKPGAVFLIDSDKEHIARDEANQMGVPVISLSGTDNNFTKVNYAIPGNDSSVKSIKFFLEQFAAAYEEGARNKKVASKTR